MGGGKEGLVISRTVMRNARGSVCAAFRKISATRGIPSVIDEQERKPFDGVVSGDPAGRGRAAGNGG